MLNDEAKAGEIGLDSIFCFASDDNASNIDDAVRLESCPDMGQKYLVH